MIKFEVSTFDVCVQGFERLRTNDEFILTAYVERGSTAAEISEQWIDDLEACQRDEWSESDWARAKACVEAFVADNAKGLANTCADLEPSVEGDDSEGCIAFLYVEQSACEPEFPFAYVEGAPHWAVYFINDDATVFETRKEQRLADRWIKANRIAHVVDVRRDWRGDAIEPDFSNRYGDATGDSCSGGDLIEYLVELMPCFEALAEAIELACAAQVEGGL